MTRIAICRPLAPLFLSLLVAGCQVLPGGSPGRGGPPPTGTWMCSNGARLDISRADGGISVADSRGPTTTLTPDPPGQAERYAAPGHALVVAGRTASWFSSGRQPSDCRR